MFYFCKLHFFSPPEKLYFLSHIHECKVNIEDRALMLDFYSSLCFYMTLFIPLRNPDVWSVPPVHDVHDEHVLWNCDAVQGC